MSPIGGASQVGLLFGAFAGVVVAAASPAWLILFAHLAEVRRDRRGLFAGLLLAAMVVTLGAGVLVTLAATQNQTALRPQLILQGAALALGSSMIWPFAYRSRRRSALARVWRAEHPGEDAPPSTRWQRRLVAELDSIVAWHSAAVVSFSGALADRGWISSHQVQAAESDRPHAASLASGRRRSATAAFIKSQSKVTRVAYATWQGGLGSDAERVNNAHLEMAAARDADFFASIEKSPLTAEQVRAVVCFDDRLRLVAAAGSGKTSTIVAKAAYAVRSGLVRPERILALSFNTESTRELQRRLDSRLGAVGISTRVQARTFHAFGSQVLGEATGRKRRVAP